LENGIEKQMENCREFVLETHSSHSFVMLKDSPM